MIGSLQYLTKTRLDITYATNQVAQFSKESRTSHLTTTKRILRYLKGTLKYGLQFSMYKNQNLFGLYDAD